MAGRKNGSLFFPLILSTPRFLLSFFPPVGSPGSSNWTHTAAPTRSVTL